MGAPVYRLAGRHAGFPPVRAVEPGRCGECWDACPRLSAGEPFDFACAGCGDCCRQRRDLVLSGFDLYRIARRLRLSPRIVAAAFCKSYIAPESCLPALRLTPDPKTGNCRFLRGAPAPSMRPARWPAPSIRWGRASTPKLQQSSIMSRPRCAAHGRGRRAPFGII